MSVAGVVFVTPHAVHQALRRVPWMRGWSYEQALTELIRQTSVPVRISGQGSIRTLHCCGFNALVDIDRRARQGRLPVLVTVIAESRAERLDRAVARVVSEVAGGTQ